MKKCGKCLVTKAFDEFHRRGSNYNTWCKSCRKEYDKVYFKKNYDKRKLQCDIIKDKFYKWYEDLKTSGGSCVDCKICYPSKIMHYHHLDPDLKLENVSEMVRAGRSKKKILEEIEKCVLLCSNCHGIRTFYPELV